MLNEVKMMQTNKLSVLLLSFGLTMGAASTAVADPIILPPSLPAPPPGLFCFKITGGNALGGGGARFQFEFLNWTDEDAHDFHITRNPDPAITTGGSFGGAPTPLAGPFSGKVNTNDWSVAVDTPDARTWIADAGAGAGTPLPFFDVDPLDDGSYPPLPYPSPFDSGINTLDGFLFDLPDLDPGERFVFDWFITDMVGAQIADDNGGFAFGTFQIDRADNGPGGELRIVQFFSAGSRTEDITNIFPVNPLSTNANAETLPPVPLPAPLLLFSSALISLLGIKRYKKSTTA